MNNELLDPKIDFVFKQIFGSEENKDVLLAFLNDTLKETEQSPLTDLTLVNPQLDKTKTDDKMSILDIFAVTADGKQINLEIQLHNKYNMQQRSLYYWAKLYSGQMKVRQNYQDLKKTITINILNFSVIPNDLYHSIFHLREDHTHHILTEDIEIHFLELSKLGKQASLEDSLVRWLTFLKEVDQSSWKELSEGMPKLKKAMNALEFLSQDREARFIAEMREKALLDERSAFINAKRLGIEEGKEEGRKEGREEGREEGIKEGKKEERLEVAKNMLLLGIDVHLILQATKLTEKEIEELRAQLPAHSQS